MIPEESEFLYNGYNIKYITTCEINIFGLTMLAAVVEANRMIMVDGLVGCKLHRMEKHDEEKSVISIFRYLADPAQLEIAYIKSKKVDDFYKIHFEDEKRLLDIIQKNYSMKLR